MTENERALAKSGEILPARTDFMSVVEAIRAEERAVEFFRELPSILFKLTVEGDWSNQGGKPYLEGHAAVRLARRFQASMKIMDQEQELLPEGYVRYGFLARVEGPGGDFVEAWGYRDSNDTFFSLRHETDSSGRWIKGSDGRWKMKKLDPDKVDTRNVKASAQTHAYHNAVTAWLGIGNPRWEDIATAWGVTVEQAKDMIGEDLYGKKAKKTSRPPNRGAPPAGTGAPPAGAGRAPAQKTNGEDPLPKAAIGTLSKLLMESEISNEQIYAFIKKEFGDDVEAFDQIKKKHFNAVQKFIERSVASGSTAGDNAQPDDQDALWNA